jgi:hypothetical protein
MYVFIYTYIYIHTCIHTYIYIHIYVYYIYEKNHLSWWLFSTQIIDDVDTKSNLAEKDEFSYEHENFS